MNAVVEKDKQYEVEIMDMSEEGQGIGKVQDFTLFIEGGIVGDYAKVCVTRLKKTFGFARVTRLITPSPFRQQPACSLYRECGGCQLQELSYEAQLIWKQQHVENCLKRIGRLASVQMEPIIGMEKQKRYRNKAQYPIRKVQDKVIIGFFAPKSHQVVEVTDCMLQPEHHARIIQIVRQFLETYKISIFDEHLKKGLVRHLIIKSGSDHQEVMVCLVINGKTLPHSEQLVHALKTLPEVKSIILSHSYEKRQVTLGESCTVLYGKEKIQDHIGPLKYNISPLAFFQVNPEQTRKLYEKVLEYASLTGKETVWDAYCGIGSISLFLAQKAKKVYGVEIVPEAIKDARENASLNHLNNTAFYPGKAEEIIPQLYQEGIVADVMVVDPPRKGCDEALLDTIKDMAPQKVVYVSCNPSTLARDLLYLTSQAGYQVEKVQPVDMFGWTSHVETVVLLQRKDM